MDEYLPCFEVTCDLIPLAVLKPDENSSDITVTEQVTCDLIPLAVLKHGGGDSDHSTSDVTCDLIPLAVLKRL